MGPLNQMSAKTSSALPQERHTLRKETRKSNVILLSYERVALFWMPYFRSLGVNVPVVLCANKSDLTSSDNTAQVIEDEMLPVMAEFKAGQKIAIAHSFSSLILK
ncbi:ERMES complex Ca(2+)-binding regulatory GTPase gem1 [Trichoglossum hirsutum]|uniref:ERMES complex Ca(2+)-binding regulatory GTPase gem1 n=1 Tax=Trichoglossum hirsutum TaxID=265104 RepID=A0A9P8IH30_9PEZI|nr:ERMES complex Ca(2+)-binding regulatory GTPase gem1 [Trichoglossum hirsutum]